METRKKMIGITGVLASPAEGAPLQQVGEPYLRAVSQAGGIPVLLYQGFDVQCYADRLDALLITGGGDIDPIRFGQENTHSRGIDAGRDEFELALCRAFVARGKPVLGICRGHQIIAVALGGTLHQDIESNLSITHPFGQGHEIDVENDSFLRAFLPARASVNSTHHQAVDDLPAGMKVSAWSDQRTAEAMEACDGRKIWGVQFHPERLIADQPAMLGIFAKLMED